jgi:O-antigen/teichoic acid export membrane protein
MGAESRGLVSVIVRGASWTTLAQLTPLVVATVLTPQIIASFGLARYGLFLLANTIAYFAASFDGGMGAAVTRYSAAYAGTDNRKSTARLVSTMLVTVLPVAAALIALLFAFSAAILHNFGVPDELLEDGVFLLRCLAVVVGILQVRSLLAAPLYARQAYQWISISTVLSYLLYAGGITITIHHNLGLRGAGITLLVQAVAQFLAIVPRAIGFLDFHGLRPMERAERREFLAFGLKRQATSITAIVNQQADTFIVAKFLTVTSVGLYGPGATFANQLRAVPLNVLTPMSTAIAQAYGVGGDESAVRLFTQLQRRWVQISTGWCATAVAASYFGVLAWLGPEFRTSAIVATTLSAAYALHLWTGTLTALLSAVGRPGLEVRYSAFSVVLNVALTIPLLMWLGIIGTVLATAISLVVASVYYLHLARARYRADLPSFFADVPVVPALAAMSLVGAIELVIESHLPVGPAGLVIAGLAAGPGLGLYALLLVGPAQVRRTAQQTALRLRG